MSSDLGKFPELSNRNLAVLYMGADHVCLKIVDFLHWHTTCHKAWLLLFPVMVKSDGPHVQYKKSFTAMWTLCTFSYHTFPFQSAWICFNTELWEQPALSVMTCCGLTSLSRVSMIILWSSQQSSPCLYWTRIKDTWYLYCLNNNVLDVLDDINHNY